MTLTGFSFWVVPSFFSSLFKKRWRPSCSEKKFNITQKENSTSRISRLFPTSRGTELDRIYGRLPSGFSMPPKKNAMGPKERYIGSQFFPGGRAFDLKRK